MLASALPSAHPLVPGRLNLSGSQSGSAPDLIPSGSGELAISKNKTYLCSEFKLRCQPLFLSWPFPFSLSPSQTTRSPPASIWFLNIERGGGALRLIDFREHVVCVGVGYMVVITSNTIRKVRSVLDSAFASFPASYIPCTFPDLMSHVACLAYTDSPDKELGT